MRARPAPERRARTAAAALCLVINLFGPATAAAVEPIDEVNPMIGTTGPTVYDYGGMIPGVTVPFGMTHWTAQTRENSISVYSYNYKDTTIRGFIGTHADSVIADAYVKGIRGFDLKKAYEATRKNAFVPPDGDTRRARGRGRKEWSVDVSP